MTLTIVIPCYGRHELLDACLASIDSHDDRVQVVLVDDGSEPCLDGVFAKYARQADVLCRQENRGRAAALREGVLRAENDYVLIMDSDDEFIPGALSTILMDLAGQKPAGSTGFVYECTHYDSGEVIACLPDSSAMTLLGLRADAGVRGDLKEVIRRDMVMKSLYPDPGRERRVPTSYIWAGVSMDGAVVARHRPVVRHRYLPGGMTKSIRQLKRDNPFWLCKTYTRVATANATVYRSRRFRMENAVKALSLKGAYPDAEELALLKTRLGATNYAICRIVSFALRTISR